MAVIIKGLPYIVLSRICGRVTYLWPVYCRWILATELRFGPQFMASQLTSLNDLIAKFNIIAIFHLLASRGWDSVFGFRFYRWGGEGNSRGFSACFLGSLAETGSEQ